MKYKVLGGKWGEGYEVGQIIDIDLDAAKVRLELGELEEVKGGKEVKVEVKENSESKMKEDIVSSASPEFVSHETKEEEKPRRGRPKRV